MSVPCPYCGTRLRCAADDATADLVKALEDLVRYLRETPHHNAVQAAAARAALEKARQP